MKKSVQKMKSLRSSIKEEYKRVPRINIGSMPARRLTVRAQHFTTISFTEAKPLIPLCGEWLRKAGFEIGDKVLVTLEDGKLIISKVELETAAMMPEERRIA